MIQKPAWLFTLLLSAVVPVVAAAVESKPAEKSDAVKRHPIRGVITAILTDRSAVMVKHEDIPGVMHAMTMMFRVDAATLKSAKEGEAITGMISRQGNAWVLEDVKAAAPKKS